MVRNIRLSELCGALKLSYYGEDSMINGLNLCNRKSGHDQVISYVTDLSYLETVRNNKSIVSLVLSNSHLVHYQGLQKERNISFIVCDQAEQTFYEIHDYLYYHTDFYDGLDFCCQIGEGCNIHPSAVIEDGVRIGNHVTIGANSVISKGTEIRDFCTVGSNTNIGSEGFQVLKINQENKKIIHCGGVLLNEKVCVGDNVVVCKALFEGNTCIGKNTMIDSLALIAHNVTIGENVVIAPGTILCGSSCVEDHAWIGVNSSVSNRVTVGNGSKIGMASVVTRDVPPSALAYGSPAKVKTIFGGGRKLGVETLKWLCGLPWVEISAVCPVPEEFDPAYASEMRKIIEENNLKVYKMEEVGALNFDVGLSVNYHRIIPATILETCKKGFYNIHHSYNLRLRGRNITTHAILNARKENIFYHGTTLHKMVPELDAGPIVATASCSIEETDTAYTLFCKADDLALQIIREWFPRIACEVVYPYLPPEEGVRYYKNRDLPSKMVSADLPGDDIYDIVRSFDFPGCAPAFFMEGSKKTELVIQKRDGYDREITLKGRLYYTTAR